MRNWMVIVLATAAIAQGSDGTKPSTPKPASAPAKATSGAAARQAPSKDEQAIFDAANRERAAHNLPPLKWNAGLASAARTHAQKMAQAGTISHEFPGEAGMGTRFHMAGVNFTSAAENVAQGPSAAVLHQEWMDSPSHRDNILDPELDSLGVAVVERNGELFAVQDFTRAAQ